MEFIKNHPRIVTGVALAALIFPAGCTFSADKPPVQAPAGAVVPDQAPTSAGADDGYTVEKDVTQAIRQKREDFCSLALVKIIANGAKVSPDNVVVFDHGQLGSVEVSFRKPVQLDNCEEVTIKEFPSLSAKQKFENLSKQAKENLYWDDKLPYATAGLAVAGTNKTYVGLEGAQLEMTALDAVYIDNRIGLSTWPESTSYAAQWEQADGTQTPGITLSNAANIFSVLEQLPKAQ